MENVAGEDLSCFGEVGLWTTGGCDQGINTIKYVKMTKSVITVENFRENGDANSFRRKTKKKESQP
jgi:hypothetical protein